MNRIAPLTGKSVTLLVLDRFLGQRMGEVWDTWVLDNCNVADTKFCVCCPHAFLVYHATPHPQLQCIALQPI